MNLFARIGGLALVVVVCVLLLMCEPKEPEVPTLDPVRPAKTLVTETLGAASARSYAGAVKAAELVDLAFRVSGPLVELPIRRGQEVEAGQVIAQIDPRDFRTNLERIASRLEQAQAELGAMKAGAREEVIRQLEAQVAAAKSEEKNAGIELGRIQKLFDEQVVSESDLDEAKLRVEIAQQKVAAAEEQLREGRKGARAEDIQAKEAQVRGLEAQRREAADALEDTTLRAPFKGVVARQSVENFQTVRANEPIISLQNIDDVEIVADIPEGLLPFVRQDTVRALTVRIDAVGDREFPVTFEEAETEADPLTRTYAITVTMPAPESVRVLPGMTATLQVVLEPQAGAGGIPVPIEAVFTSPEGGSRLWVVDPETLTVSSRAVEIETLEGGQALVTAGLEGGEEIVTAGVHFLREEMKIRRLEPRS